MRVSSGAADLGLLFVEKKDGPGKGTVLGMHFGALASLPQVDLYRRLENAKDFRKVFVDSPIWWKKAKLPKLKFLLRDEVEAR